jgi:hypothetical protein
MSHVNYHLKYISRYEDVFVYIMIVVEEELTRT